MLEEYILRMDNITKVFPGVRALDNVCFNVRRGEIHALVGENGAGKSTLMKILSGSYPNYEGKLFFGEEERNFRTIKDSEEAGITIIYQELNLIKSMSICENIFLGNEIKKNGVIQWNKQMQITQALVQRLGLEARPSTKIEDIGVGKQQLVEIAKALNKQTKLLILDEPTASLTDTDTENLFSILRQLKAEGTTCIYISHKLGEIFKIADRVTVLRDGQSIITGEIGEFDENRIISHMVGRELVGLYPREAHTPGETVLELKDWTVPDVENPAKNLVEEVNLQIRKGEILGIAGLMGAGRTELAMSIFGVYRHNGNGSLMVEGKPVRIKNPGDAISHGISYVSEDRKRFGLVLGKDVKENISLASLHKLMRYGRIDSNREIKQTNEMVDALKIRTPSIAQLVKNLSGGNQQKVILGKWLLTEPKVLILDEPTRGIDVGAKREIYTIMNQLVEQGVCIVMISSEMQEILGISDRIVVMHEGKISGEADYQNTTQEILMRYAIGDK